MESLKLEVTPPLFISIWFGANDATLSWVNVPKDAFVANLQHFVDCLLEHPNLKTTKVILITTPPINARPPKHDWDPDDADVREDLVFITKEGLGWKTWLNKMQYAEACLELGKKYGANGNGDRVAVCDVWTALGNFGLGAQGRDEIKEDEDLTEDLVDEKLPPGCGLPGAGEFPEGVFVDRLHFGELVRRNMLLNTFC